MKLENPYRLQILYIESDFRGRLMFLFRLFDSSLTPLEASSDGISRRNQYYDSPYSNAAGFLKGANWPSLGTKNPCCQGRSLSEFLALQFPQIAKLTCY